MSSATPFTALSLTELAEYQFPPIDWVVDEVLPVGALVLLVGRSKAGKSLLTLDLAASVGLGEPFVDQATMQGPVIYVPAEDALRRVGERLWTRIGAERHAPIHVLPADGTLEQAVRLDDPESFGRLAVTVEKYQPRVLILDPFREFHHRKENDADEMAALMRPLRQLAHETDTLIVLNHHRNKHATDSTLATRGSSAITGGVDIVIALELSDESSDEGLTPDQVLTLRIEGRYGPRQRLAARLRPGLRWEPAAPGSLTTSRSRTGFGAISKRPANG
jgi:RecA-family ATPase